jgi:GNAT superfamily N-acetyltransferase
MDKWEELLHEAFPPEEYLPSSLFLDMCDYLPNHNIAIYENDEFIGYMGVVITDKVSYLNYFAIKESHQDKGVGTKGINYLKETFKHPVIIDCEPLDENAPNNEQRIRRKKFYYKNGFKETGYFQLHLGVIFENMATGPIEFAWIEEIMSGARKHTDPEIMPRYFDSYQKAEAANKLK